MNRRAESSSRFPKHSGDFRLYPLQLFLLLDPVRDRKRLSLFFRYRFPIPVFKYFSLALASCSLKQAS
jgi:hypothetical protein